VIDETGIMLQPVVRRTWSLIGVTPLLIPSYKHDRWSVIGALTVSPERRRLGLYFQHFDHNIRGEDCERFVGSLHQQLRRPLLVVWDGLSAHKTAANLLADKGDRIVFERFPAYAPELNPVEYLWSHTKYGRLANLCADDFHDLGSRSVQALYDTRCEKHLLLSFFRAAELTLCF